MIKFGWNPRKLSTRVFSMTALSVAIPLMVGCGGGNDQAMTAESGSTQVASSGQAPQATASSVTVVESGVGTEPAQCVAIFLDSLRRGDERAANGVLTTKAREELAKTTYVIQPLGTPEGQYQIGRVGFPYEDKSVALVECSWAEPPQQGETQVTMDIVCEVHLEAEGWRISGIGVTIPETNEALVLDFEDATALQATIDSATGQTSAPQQPPAGQQMVSQDGLRQQMPPAGLPSYPSVGQYPAGGQSPNGNQLPSYPPEGQPNGLNGNAARQIALPPAQYDDRINR